MRQAGTLSLLFLSPLLPSTTRFSIKQLLVPRTISTWILGTFKRCPLSPALSRSSKSSAQDRKEETRIHHRTTDRREAGVKDSNYSLDDILRRMTFMVQTYLPSNALPITILTIFSNGIPVHYRRGHGFANPESCNPSDVSCSIAPEDQGLTRTTKAIGVIESSPRRK